MISEIVALPLVRVLSYIDPISDVIFAPSLYDGIPMVIVNLLSLMANEIMAI
jgi:hypothetical protein